MEIDGWSSIDMAVKHLKGKVVIHGGLNCKDIYSGITEQAKNESCNKSSGTSERV